MDFAGLGIPFPLFEADASAAPSHVGPGACAICEKDAGQCFRLGIGADVIRPCPGCGTDNPLSADDRRDVACRRCGELVPFLEDPGADLLCCYECLRAGKAAFTKDTPAGMVRWLDAQAGLTHGAPTPAAGIMRIEGFDAVPSQDDWVRVRVPKEELLELVLTPGFDSLQGDMWLFHCRRPMIYTGSVLREFFAGVAHGDDPRQAFDQIIEDARDEAWQALDGEQVRAHVFRCRDCGGLRGYWEARD